MEEDGNEVGMMVSENMTNNDFSRVVGLQLHYCGFDKSILDLHKKYAKNVDSWNLTLLLRCNDISDLQ